MKKIIVACLLLTLVFAAVSCTEAPEGVAPGVPAANKPTSLAELQARIRADGKLLGVAYLGWFEGDADAAREALLSQDYLNEISFVKEIDLYAENEGCRIYAIVPAADDVKISVCKCVFGEEYLPYDGEELIAGAAPILVRGNLSDTIPNLYVIAKKGSDKVCYMPGQSGKDGRLENSEEMVYDFTPYASMPEFCGFDRVPDVVFCGDWLAFEKDGNGAQRTLRLTLMPDGGAQYAYGIGNSEVLERFEGTWELENDIIKLQLDGGPPSSLENPVLTETYDCNPSFAWDLTAEGLWLEHIAGDEILFGTAGRRFLFVAQEEGI